MFKFEYQIKAKMTTKQINQMTEKQLLRLFKRNATERKVEKGLIQYVFNRGENFPFYKLFVHTERIHFCGHGRILAYGYSEAAKKIRTFLIDNYRFHTFKTDF